MQKGGLKSFDPSKGGLEKNDHKLSWENWGEMIFYGVDP